MKRDEDKLQKACVRILKYRYWWLKNCWHHSPSEGKRTEFQGAMLKEMGMTTGWPDLEICHNGTTLFIEFKTKTGRQSQAQKDVQAALEAQGFTYIVCRSVEQFIEICHKYLGEERDPDRETLKAILNQ